MRPAEGVRIPLAASPVKAVGKSRRTLPEWQAKVQLDIPPFFYASLPRGLGSSALALGQISLGKRQQHV